MASGEAIDSGAPYFVRRQTSPSAPALDRAASEIYLAWARRSSVAASS